MNTACTSRPNDSKRLRGILLREIDLNLLLEIFTSFDSQFRVPRSFLVSSAFRSVMRLRRETAVSNGKETDHQATHPGFVSGFGQCSISDHKRMPGSFRAPVLSVAGTKISRSVDP